MSAEIEQVSLAVTAINKVESGIAALRERFAGVVFEVTTPAGMEAAREARRAVRDPRLEVERIRKAAKAPILALGKQLDSTAARITAELEKIEEPIHEQIIAEEARREREKEAKIAAELARVEAIDKKIAEIRHWPIQGATIKDTLTLADLCAKADSYEVHPAVFEEKTQSAIDSLTISRAALAHLLSERKAQEARDEQARKDAEELAKLRAEAAERERKAAEEQARKDAEAATARAAQEAAERAAREKADAEAKAERDRLEAIAKAERDAELARQAESNRIERERIAEEDRVARIHREAEAERLAEVARLEREDNERIARERQEALDKQEAEARAKREEEEAAAKAVRDAQATEAARLEQEKADIARREEELRKASEPKPVPSRKRKSAVPTEAELLALVETHYCVSTETARGYLSLYNWRETAAA